MTDPRQLLDDYAEETEWSAEALADVPRLHKAPKAFAALRAVLAECDFLDTCIADYKGYEIAGLIRGSITKALEAK